MSMSVDERDGCAEKTLAYYNGHAQEFAETTKDIPLHQLYAPFEARLKPGATILDFGCGSARDTLHFMAQGFTVVATDGSVEFVKRAHDLYGIEVRHELFSELSDVDAYDGIWACSSILHVPKAELHEVLDRMARALHPDGIIYTSFKVGDFEGMRHGRYFTDFTEASFRDFMATSDGLAIDAIWHTTGFKPGRGYETWLNILLTRS